MSMPQSSSVPPAVLPPDVVKRLTLARYQLVRARLQLSVATEFNAWQASVALHDAAEICLLAIADFRRREPESKKSRVYLGDYPGLLKRETGHPFYDAGAIEAIVEVRNPAKHRGAFPSVTDVRALVERIGLMLDRNCATYVDTPLSAISLADMIEDTEAREFVKAAEALAQRGQNTDAIVALKHAWRIAISRFRDRFVGRGLPSPWFPMAVQSGSAAGKEITQAVERWWREVLPTLELLMLGVDLPRYLAFEGVTPDVWSNLAGQVTVNLSGEEPVMHTAGAVQFCLAFVLDTIVRLQEVERVPQRGSYYSIRLKAESEYFDTTDSQYNSAGKLAKGETIDGARFALGRGAGNSWAWQDPQTKRTYLIPFEAAEVIRATPSAEYERATAERQAKAGRKKR